MFKYLDPYTLRARLLPAIIAAAPAFAAIALLISWDHCSLSNSIATVGLAALLVTLADLARRLGKKIEPQLYQDMGGKPTVTMLRHSDCITFDAVTGARYRKFLGEKINETPPTEASEMTNPAAADAFYDRCGGWLRENTRNAKKFNLVFNENVTYGFRRNLLGLKGPALALSLFVVLLCFWLLNRGSVPLQDIEHLDSRILVVLIITALHAMYISMGVSKVAAVEAARAYSRQLIYSCETFLGNVKPVAAKPKNPKKVRVAGSGMPNVNRSS